MKLALDVRSGHKLRPLVIRLLLLSLFIILLLLTAACIWATREYANITIGEVLFYLFMPLQGTAQQFSRSLLKRVILPTGILALFLVVCCLRPRKGDLTLEAGKRKMRLLPLDVSPRVLLPVMAVWLVVLLHFGDRLLDIRGYIDGYIHQSTFIEENYVDPKTAKLTFPETKRNLITVYLESAETTNQDVASGGHLQTNFIPEMTRLEQENISFSQDERFSGAAVAPACGWTIAGLLAESAGVPLKYYKYDNTKTNQLDNEGYNFKYFMPGIWTLGDILEQEGYKTLFVAGSDFDFGGRRLLYRQHGHYSIYDYYNAVQDGVIPDGYILGWGFEDQKLYEVVRRKLLELAEGGQPFHLAFLTQDTHTPGYLCELCEKDDTNIYGRALRCSSKQVADFIAWCQEQDFYENTTIVITGDHASMDASFYDSNVDDYEKHEGDTNRLVYNCFINATETPVQEKNRRFTTLDIYPTTLAAMGVAIEGERLGLGTNLFSDKETLAEQYGYETMFAELNKRSVFYDRELLYP